jgi:molybdopterin biosynthesis enzyme MoaB
MAGGAGLRTADYTLNTLNQITQRTVPGAMDITWQHWGQNSTFNIW